MIVLVSIILAFFGLVVFFGAPYVPTHKSEIDKALELLDLKPDQLLIELGSGDGRMLKAAASVGCRAIGYEMNPVLWLVSIVNTKKHRNQVKTYLKNYKVSRWPEDIDGIYIFSSSRDMTFLHSKLKTIKTPFTLVTYGFELSDHEPVKQIGALVKYRFN